MKMNPNRKYFAISIKHTEWNWKFGMPCVLWGYHRTKDDEKRCFAGYTENPECAELYTVEEFLEKYRGIVYEEPVNMSVKLCKTWKGYDTVLIDAEEYKTYYKMINS